MRISASTMSTCIVKDCESHYDMIGYAEEALFPHMIRGLLCQTHNRMLGLAGDRIDILQKSLEYLMEHK